jgi:hypothetical protein
MRWCAHTYWGSAEIARSGRLMRCAAASNRVPGRRVPRCDLSHPSRSLLVALPDMMPLGAGQGLGVSAKTVRNPVK